ncbi:MAG: hypothetical protein E4G89_04200 [Methanothrix sp.]|nr:MAG: hypothetical protein E4G89_04200 [Methanothrix sp.]
MKLSKSTTVLVNVILVLLVVLLVKSLLVHPREAQAGAGTKYTFFELPVAGNSPQVVLDSFTNQGQKLHSYQFVAGIGGKGVHVFIFEK